MIAGYCVLLACSKGRDLTMGVYTDPKVLYVRGAPLDGTPASSEVFMATGERRAGRSVDPFPGANACTNACTNF